MPRTPEVCSTAFCPLSHFSKISHISNIASRVLRILLFVPRHLPSAFGRLPSTSGRRPIIFSTFCFLILLITYNSSLITVDAQSATATLSGTVVDQNGAVIPEVKIAVISIAQGFQRLATTKEEGTFVVPLLPPGNYTVKAEHEGFTQSEMRDVVLNVNAQVRITIHMKIGTLSQTVEIVEGGSLINESPAVATVVDRQFVGNLPLNGRSFQSLLTLTPGVVTTAATSFNRGQFSVNGQRANANYFTVDGVSANIGANSSDGISQDFAGSLPGFTTFGSTNSLVSVDALQEFKIQTSTYAPEFGRTPGGQVQILTRSGANDFHGTLFEYFRNDGLDARDWFVNANRLSKPALRQNDFGFVLGGPVLFPRFGEGGPLLGYNGHNRTFFFFSYEGLQLRQPQTENRVVAALRLRQNAPLPLRPVLNALPVPTGAEIGATGQAPYAASFSNPSTMNATSLRIDHVVGSKLSLFSRYNDAPSQTVTRSLSELTTTALDTRTATFGATLALSPRLSNETRINYSTVEGQSRDDLDNFGGAVPFARSLLVPADFLDQRSTVSIDFVGPALGRIFLGTNVDNFQRQINIVDNLSLVRGEHQLKFGVDYRRLMPIYNPRDYAQSAIFFGQTAILNGRATIASVSAIKSSRPLFTNFSAYGQDTWKAVRRLTLTYGLRWDVNPPPSEANGNLPFALIGLESKATIAFAPSGTRLYKTTYDNIAPRVGFAYQLARRPARETLLRGGSGIFYDLGNGQTGEAFTRHPFSTGLFRKFFSGQLYPLTPNQAAPPSFNLLPPPFSINGYDPNLKLPYTWQWNASIEQSVGSNQVFSATYVGAAGRRLLRTQIMANPNPTFSQIVFTNNDATSDYHAMQLQFQRRLSRGLQALASYAWSHAIDEVSDESGSGLSNIVRGNSDFDVRHNFSAGITYNFPTPRSGYLLKHLLGKWATDAIVRWQSAPPFSITSGSEVDPQGRTFLRRVNVTPGIPLYLDDPNAPGGKRLNNTVDPSRPGCKGPFCPAPAGRQGNLARNSLRGFPLNQIDFALRRQFNLTERVNFQFRAEAFNLFNHPNFALPNNDLTSTQFGQATRTLGTSLSSLGNGLSPLFQVGGPRSIQFALRLNF